MFQEVDDYRHSGLSASHQAALALTDALIWTPANMRETDIEAVRTHLQPAEAVEVVLDVMRTQPTRSLSRSVPTRPASPASSSSRSTRRAACTSHDPIVGGRAIDSYPWAS